MRAPHAHRYRLLAAAAIGVAATVLFAVPALAKGTGNVVISSTLPPVSTDCSPVHSFKTSAVAGVGDTGLSSISADYDVKPFEQPRK